jgi:hypothetical protein
MTLLHQQTDQEQSVQQIELYLVEGDYDQSQHPETEVLTDGDMCIRCNRKLLYYTLWRDTCLRKVTKHLICGVFRFLIGSSNLNSVVFRPVFPGGGDIGRYLAVLKL